VTATRYVPTGGAEPASSVAPRPLRIAMIAPPWFEVPPTSYGGIEAVVAELVDALLARGHEVSLIGAGPARTAASRYFAVYDAPPSSRVGEPLPQLVHAAAAGRILDGLDVDVVHDHSLAGPLLARGREVPTVVTAHGEVTGEPGAYLGWLGCSVSLVAISDAQRRLAGHLSWAGRVHNGLRVETFPYRAAKDDYVLFLGRFGPEKGAHLAIDAARAAGRRIVLAGKCREPVERDYFERAVRPRLGAGVEHVGEADAALKRELLAGARCLLFPVCWEEPFGMVMIEAMACGTPVVGLRRGSVPEIVRHEVTGVVVDHPDRLPWAVEEASRVSPAACREHVERNFSVSAMTTGYERIYAAAIDAAAGRLVPGSGTPGPELGPIAVPAASAPREGAVAVDLVGRHAGTGAGQVAKWSSTTPTDWR
jgi:glycosyltransferase involved in cell wall biosynthesis